MRFLQIYIFFFFLFPLFCNAQNEFKDEFSFLKEKILLHKNNPDSLLYYYLERAKLEKKTDKYADYIYTFCYDIYYDVCKFRNYSCILPYLNTIKDSLWRAPLNIQDSIALITLYDNQGFTLSQLNINIPNAKNALEKARQLMEDAPYHKDNKLVARIYNSLGNAYTILGDNERAIKHFQDAIQKDFFSNEQKSSFYINQARAYWNNREYQKAIEAALLGLKLSDISSKRKRSLLTELATNYLEINDYEKSLFYIQKALDLVDDKTTDKNIASLQSIQAEINFRQNKLEDAQVNIEAAIDFQTKAGGGRYLGKYLVKLAQILSLKGNNESALKIVNQAIGTVLPNFKPNNLLENPAKKTFYPENTILEALEAKANILEKVYRENQDKKYLKAALESHGLVFEVEQLLRQSYLYESSKISLLSKSRQRSEKAIDLALQLYEVENDFGILEQAFQFAENSKSIILLDAIKKNFYLTKVVREDELFHQEKRLQKEMLDLQSQLKNSPADKLSELQQNIRDIELDLEKNQKNITQKYPNYSKAVYAKKLKHIKIDSDDQVVLEYFVGEKNIFLFYLHQGDLKAYRIPYDNKLKNQLEDYLTFFSNKSKIENQPLDYLSSANEIYQSLFPNELQSILANHKKLTIIPDDILNFIPFEALVTKDTKSTNLGTAPYFIKKHIVQYAFSWNVLLEQMQRKSNNETNLAMAPIFENKERGLVPLLNSSKEISHFDASFIAQKATLSTFQKNAPSSKIIHLSTHAQIDNQGIPQIEFIDSTLALPSLYVLNLDADLVVLSACETNLGKLEKGEGLMSLARGFAYVGASSLIASLWSINDYSTSNIIIDFYQNISKNQSTTEALHHAKINYLSDPSMNHSPIYWSSLSYIGADQSFQQSSKIWLILALPLVLIFLYIYKKSNL